MTLSSPLWLSLLLSELPTPRLTLNLSGHPFLKWRQRYWMTEDRRVAQVFNKQKIMVPLQAVSAVIAGPIPTAVSTTPLATAIFEK